LQVAVAVVENFFLSAGYNIFLVSAI